MSLEEPARSVPQADDTPTTGLAKDSAPTQTYTSAPVVTTHNFSPLVTNAATALQSQQQLASISATELLSTVPSGTTVSSTNGRSRVEVKLFVGRLPRSIDEATLGPMFSAYGEVVETVIIRDKATGTHKGSGFVKMASLTDADAAVRALHNVKVVDPQLGPIQVKYANGEPERLGLSTDSAQPGSDVGKLFVGSLPRTVAEAEVRQVFEPYGRIDEVVLMKDSATGQAKGCAFVKFAFKEHAINAIKFLHSHYTFPGCPRPLEVKFAENRRAAASQAAVMPGGGYSGTSPMGGGLRPQAVPGMIPPQPSNLNPRTAGGWTEYFTADGRAYYHHEITKTTQWTKPVEFDRLLMVPPPAAAAPPPSAGGGPGGPEVAGPPGANVFVFHIPNEWGQNEVVSQFSQYGRVISCYVATDRATGRNKGYGFVSYDNIQSAASAVLGMNGYPVGSKRLKVSIKTGEEGYVSHLLGQPGQQQQQGATHPGNAPPNGGMGGGPPPSMGYGPVGVYGAAAGLAYNRSSPY